VSPDDSPHYRFENVAEGIHAAIARPSGFAICNSGIADLGDGGLVFDSGMTPDSGRDLLHHASRLLGHRPSVAVTSHRHLDHVLGNSEFAGIPIWGTRRTREIMLATSDQMLAELGREQLEKEVADLEGRRDTLRTEDGRADLEFTLQIYRAALACTGRFSIAPPDRTFDTRLTLPGDRNAELVSLGHGHTEADAFLFLPHEKVLFAGDLVVVGVQPSLGDSDPEHWIQELDQIERMAPERLVPGHGPVTDREGIRDTRDYLAGILEAVRASPTAPLPRAIRRWEGSVSLEGNLTSVKAWVQARSSRA